MRKGTGSCTTTALCAALLRPWPGKYVVVWCLVTCSIIKLNKRALKQGLGARLPTAEGPGCWCGLSPALTAHRQPGDVLIAFLQSLSLNGAQL